MYTYMYIMFAQPVDRETILYFFLPTHTT